MEQTPLTLFWRSPLEKPASTLPGDGQDEGGQLRTVQSEHLEISLQVKYTIRMEHRYWKQMRYGGTFLFSGCSTV